MIKNETISKTAEFIGDNLQSLGEILLLFRSVIGKTSKKYYPPKWEYFDDKETTLEFLNLLKENHFIRSFNLKKRNLGIVLNKKYNNFLNGQWFEYYIAIVINRLLVELNVVDKYQIKLHQKILDTDEREIDVALINTTNYEAFFFEVKTGTFSTSSVIKNLKEGIPDRFFDGKHVFLVHFRESKVKEIEGVMIQSFETFLTRFKEILKHTINNADVIEKQFQFKCHIVDYDSKRPVPIIDKKLISKKTTNIKEPLTKVRIPDVSKTTSQDYNYVTSIFDVEELTIRETIKTIDFIEFIDRTKGKEMALYIGRNYLYLKALIMRLKKELFNGNYQIEIKKFKTEKEYECSKVLLDFLTKHKTIDNIVLKTPSSRTVVNEFPNEYAKDLTIKFRIVNHQKLAKIIINSWLHIYCHEVISLFIKSNFPYADFSMKIESVDGFGDRIVLEIGNEKYLFGLSNSSCIGDAIYSKVEKLITLAQELGIKETNTTLIYAPKGKEQDIDFSIGVVNFHRLNQFLPTIIKFNLIEEEEEEENHYINSLSKDEFDFQRYFSKAKENAIYGLRVRWSNYVYMAHRTLGIDKWVQSRRFKREMGYKKDNYKS